MGSLERREALALAAALALHAAVLAARVRFPPAVTLPAPEISDVIELSTEPVPVLAAPEPAAAPAESPALHGGDDKPSPEPPGRAVAEPAAKAKSIAERDLPVEPAVRAEGPPVKGPEVVNPQAPSPRGTLGEPPPPDAPGGSGVVGLPPGLGGRPAWAIPGVMGPLDNAAPAAAPTAAPAARPVDRNIAAKVIDGTLKRRDHDLGLDTPAAGVVAGALTDAVRSSAIPGDARATFEVRLGANGNVEGVALKSASAGDAGAWDRVVRAAKGSLAGRALRMGEGGQRGATVTVKVESKTQYPAGNKEKVIAEPVCLNEIVDQITAALQDPSQIGAGPPLAAGRGATLGAGFMPPAGYEWDEQRKKFCIPVGVRGKGDVSNIGAHAQTVVRSTFSVKRDGEKALPAEDILPIDTRVPWAREDPTLRKPPPKPKKKKPGPGRR